MGLCDRFFKFECDSDKFIDLIKEDVYVTIDTSSVFRVVKI